MSSLRLALKQSLQETGHLMKDKKKKPGKNTNKSSSTLLPSSSSNPSSATSNKQRRSHHHHPPSGGPGSSDVPRKRGRPRKNSPEGDGGDDSQNNAGDELQQGQHESPSGSETEGSESENEFSYDSEEEVDDSNAEGEEEEGEDDEEDAEKEGDSGRGHYRDKAADQGGESGQTAYNIDLRAASTADPTSPEDEKSHGDSEEERRRQKKLFKKHLQQAANKIQAQWKKKAGLVAGVDSDNERQVSGDSSGGLSPMRNRDTTTNSSSSTPNNAAAEKKKTKASKSQTVPPPDAEVLEWNRALPEKKCKKYIATGMRVKVCFAAKVKRDGKVFKKKIWYGGRVSAVSKDGSKIRIKYDDGTSEISKFPDKDVVVDDNGNGEHLVSTHKFIPPPPREEMAVDHEADDEQGGDERRAEPTMNTVDNERYEPINVALGSDTNMDGPTNGSPEEMDAMPKETGAFELKDTEMVTPFGKVPTETEQGGIYLTTPLSSTTINLSTTDDARNGSLEDGELSPGLSLVSQEKPTDIDVKVTKSTSIEEGEATLEDGTALHVDNEVKDSGGVSDSLPNAQVESKKGKASNYHDGVPPCTPKLTIRISNVTATKVQTSVDSDSDEELCADTPVTERKVKSIQLKRKPKRRRDLDRSADDQPSKKRTDIKQNEERYSGLEFPQPHDAAIDKNLITPKPLEELSALVDTPQAGDHQDNDASEASLPDHDSVELPMLPTFEKKKERSKTPSPTADKTPVPSRSTSPSQNATEVAHASEEKLVLKLPSLEPENSLHDTKSHVPMPDESESEAIFRSKDIVDTLSGSGFGLKNIQQGKVKGTDKQEEKLEKLKKKRKRKEEEDEGELSDTSVDDRQWVQCDSCAKWRILPSEVKVASLPKHWYCHLNTYDPKRNNCAAPEQTAKQAAKEWRKARKRAKQQRLAELKEAEVALEVPHEFEKNEPVIPISPKSGKGKKIKRISPIFTEESLSGPDVPKTEKKSKNKGKPPLEVCEPVQVAVEVEPPKKPGRKRGRPARNQTPQKENDGQDNVEWVQCEKCEKWRKLPPHVSADELPDTWYCKMNTWNQESASCNAPEDKADASHHEVGNFAGMFGAGAGKNSYRALIFGTGKKHNRPMSERARAAESLFMRPIDDAENPCPTVMYSASSCFMPRTSNFTKANAIDEEKPPGVFDVLSNSDLFAELRGVGRPWQVTSSGASRKVHMFVNTPDDIKQILSEIVLRSLGDGVLTGEELILTMHSFPWESLSLDFVEVRPYFNADIIINILLTLVRDGVVEMTSFRDLRIPMGQWIPRYRKVRSLRARTIEESIKASRCMKIAKPWKQRDLGKASGSEWVTGVSAFP